MIALTQRLVKNESYHEVRDALDIRWGALFAEIGCLPIVLPTEYDFRRYFEACAIEGVLLTGGNDLGSLSDDGLSLKRDAFEKEIIRYAIENNIPIYGVCRGMQIIADYFGAQFAPVEGHAGSRHRLQVSERSKYAREMRKLGDVNSYHRYAVSSLPKGFLLAATSGDGVVEAIEHETMAIFAQMWHCERETPPRPEDMAILRKFFHD